jgi:hypothetical protein
MVNTVLFKKGIIINKDPNISDIYYSKEYNKYFYKISSIYNININIFILIDNILDNYIEKIDKEFIIYDNTTDDKFILDDYINILYNSDGKRIFLSNFKKIYINNIDTDNDNSEKYLMPFGVIH